jgi:hypothetical protein
MGTTPYPKNQATRAPLLECPAWARGDAQTAGKSDLPWYAGGLLATTFDAAAIQDPRL